MKRKLYLFFFIASLHTVFPQFAEHHAIYVTGEIGLGNYIGADINLNYVLHEKYSVKVGYAAAIRKPQARPSDYSSGITGLLSFGLANPYDQQNHYQLAVGRIYKLNGNGKIRLNLSLGVAYSTIKEPQHWEPNGDGLIGPNYSWQYEQWHTTSIIVNPKIEFPLGRCYGLTVSPMAQINKYSSYFGIGIGQMIGVLRKRYIKPSM